MEEAEACLGQFSRGGQAQSFAEIAEQHVGALDLVEGFVESASDRFLDETFFQADAQVAADDFHDVLGFERSGSLKKRAQKSAALAAGPRAAAISANASLHFGEREAGIRLCGKRLGCDRSGIAMPAINFGQFGLGFSREFR
jgi:hypothetical protein